jgi:hydroxymethylglutaryl-CoA lyase
VLGCPYEGYVPPENVKKVVGALLDMGCYEVSLGDTIGVGNPVSTELMIQKVLEVAKVEQLAAHFHNTYGTALANLVVALQMGVRTVDSSVAGLGGCPYARGATGEINQSHLDFGFAFFHFGCFWNLCCEFF